jgi:hypothetical protein
MVYYGADAFGVVLAVWFEAFVAELCGQRVYVSGDDG